MHGARWGWAAFIAAVAILFAAHKEEGPAAGKQLPLLRQELQSLQGQLDQALAERNDARDLSDQFESGCLALERRLSETQSELRRLQEDQKQLRQDLARISLDRAQLQQTISGLQQERVQTQRNVEQLRQGLQHLLSQAEAVASTLQAPAPGVAQIQFDDAAPLHQEVMVPVSLPLAAFPQHPSSGIPLNKNP